MRMHPVVIGALVVAVVLLVLAWSATPAGLDLFEMLRVAVFAFGAVLVVWNLVPGADESLTNSGPRALRLRQFLLGLAIAVAAVLAPRPWPSDATTVGHELVSRLQALLERL